MRRTTLHACLVVGGAIAFVGCGGGTDRDRETVEQHNMAVVRETHAALARGDFDSFRAALATDYVRHCQAMPPGLEELRGTTEFLAFLEEFVAAAPGYEDTLSQMIAEGDKVAYVSTLTGVQTGPLGDLPATGREFTLVNIIIQRLEDGRIAETWVSWDNVAFLSQLGLFPPQRPPNEG